jgi:proteasome lid subunit RPN8/RPN11
MIEHARQGFPNEACGIIAAQHGRAVEIYPMANADRSPKTYRMDPQEQLRVTMEIEDREWEIGAIFHSHPHTRAYPSVTDVRLAFYPDALYIIVSLADPESPDLHAFRIVDGQISEEPLQIERV